MIAIIRTYKERHEERRKSKEKKPIVRRKVYSEDGERGARGMPPLFLFFDVR